MNINYSSQVPIFLQIAQQLEDAIFSGIYEEQTQVPSTNELSALLNINPQTVLKGVTLLVNEGIIYKKRGVGMFVADGAVNTVREKRMAAYYETYIKPMVKEAKALGVDEKQLLSMIERGYDDKR